MMEEQIKKNAKGERNQKCEGGEEQIKKKGGTKM